MQYFEELLAIEEDLALWEYQIEDIRLWPLVRSYVMGAALNDYQGFSTVKKNPWAYFAPHTWKQLLRGLQLLFFHPQRKYTTAFFKTNVTRYPKPDTKQSFDRLYDDYFRLFDNPLILEEQPVKGLSLPDHRFQSQIFSENTLRGLAYIESLPARVSTRHTAQITEFAALVSNAYHQPQLERRLQHMLIDRITRYTPLKRLLKQHIVSQLSTQVVFIHHASYMGQRALLTKAFHQFGFRVIEIQHGMVHRAHKTYNYPESLATANHPCLEYLPDMLLTFGDYWTESIRVPYKCHSVGNPYLNKAVAELQTTTPANPKQILVISQGTVSQLSRDIVARLSDALPEHAIVLKLHPQNEVPHIAEFAEIARLPNVRLVGIENIYKLIAESAIIVGHYSTVLFEALAFEQKHIFAWDHEAIPDEICTKVSSIENLIEQIQSATSTNQSRNPERYWCTDWEQRIKHAEQLFLTDTESNDSPN